jgi:DNA (cytosine-5)-methyltransferase 1
VTLTFGSVCSGIEAASVAWEPLGWRAAWFAEIEPFPCAVLAQRFPGVPNLGDMTTIAARILEGQVAAPDVLVGGTPCQSFSIAGLRKGLADDRGNLALEFIRLGDAIDTVRRAAGKPPAFILWENVPGVLSDTGNAFGTFLAGLVGSDAAIATRGRWTNAGVVHGPGRCAAWRILDAQHHALAQRRERVFVLSRAGARAWSAADALLPILESLRWHPAPRREAGKGIAGALATRPDRGGVNIEGADGKLIPEIAGAVMPSPSRNRSPNEDATLLPELATTLRARDAKQTPDSDCTGTLLAFGGNNTSGPIDVAAALNACGTASGRQDFESETFITEIAPTLTANGKAAGSATQQDTDGGSVGVLAFDTYNQAETGEVTQTLCSRGDTPGGNAHLIPAVQTGMAVRRLTPRECERLQGFPDDHTLIVYRGKPAADGPRYRALGNSMAVPVMRAIGYGIANTLKAEVAQ